MRTVSLQNGYIDLSTCMPRARYASVDLTMVLHIDYFCVLKYGGIETRANGILLYYFETRLILNQYH